MQCQTGARVRVRHRSSISGRRSESGTSVVSYVLENDPPGWLLYHTLSIKYTPPVNTPWPSTSPTVHLYPAQMPEEHERYRWGLKDWLRLSVHWVTAGIKDGGGHSVYTVLSLGPWSVQIRTIVAFLWISKFCCRLNSVFRPQHWGGRSS